MSARSKPIKAQPITIEQLQAENSEQRRRLEEAQETIRAIQEGAVDAFVVEEKQGHRIYTLEGADRPYRLFVEQMQQGAATLNADGTIGYCNQRLADLLKIPHEKLMGASVHDHISPDDQPQFDELFSQARTRSSIGESHLRLWDGRLLPVLLTFNALPADCGETIGLLITDLTAQRLHEQLTMAHEALARNDEQIRHANAQLAKRLNELEEANREILLSRRTAIDLMESAVQAKDALSRAKEFDEAVMDNMAEGLYSLDKEGLVTFLNPAAEHLFGWTLKELQGRKMHDVTHYKHRDGTPYPAKACAGFQVLQRGEQVANQEDSFIHKDGSFFDVVYSCSPIRDGQAIVGAVVVFRDVTEYRQAQQALRESEERYRSLTGILTSLVWTSDAQGAFIVPQPEWEAFTGQTWEEHRGWGWANALHPDDREQVQSVLRHSLETHSPYESRSRLWHAPSNKYHYVVARSIPLFRADGSVREWIGNVLDTQEQKQAEEQRERALIAEREAREASDTASRAKDEFLATVSHELRSPLNAMLGWARLLSGGMLNNETATRALKAIEQNAKAQAQLIEDLLDVSRIISGKFHLNNEPIRIAPVIEAALDSVRPAAAAKGVKLRLRMDSDDSWISGDSGRMQQVVWNLLSNAVKFTPMGGEVQVRLTCVGSHIKITVSDTGQGIVQEFLPYVFDRFRQADGSSTRAHGGLGIGLAIVRHITELHGGSVAAESPGIGQGATFTVKLPLLVNRTRQGKPSDDFIAKLRWRTDASSFLSLEGVKVLVVDDDPETLLLLSTALTQVGAYVKTAVSAEEGFSEVRAWRPNVIVSDIGLPGEDGYSFMARVKNWTREVGSWIPAVALTAYARTEDRVKALSSGYQIHVAKPVEPAELIAVLVSIVERLQTS